MGTLSSEIAEIVLEFRIDLNLDFTRWKVALRSGLRAMYARGALRKYTPDRLDAFLVFKADCCSRRFGATPNRSTTSNR